MLEAILKAFVSFSVTYISEKPMICESSNDEMSLKFLQETQRVLEELISNYCNKFFSIKISEDPFLSQISQHLSLVK